MKRFLGAFVVCLLAAGVLAQSLNRSGTMMQEAIQDLRPVRGSMIGADPELLQMAMQEAGRQLDAQRAGGAVTQPEALLVISEDDARRALETLVGAYNLKQRARFMRFVSYDFNGDRNVLDDALSSDFRTYRDITLAVIFDKVDLQGVQASVQFRYDMRLFDNSGQLKTFSGRTRYIFKLEDDGVTRLVKMDAPIIFGTSLPAGENPVATSQGPSVQSGSTAPGAATCPTPAAGSAQTQDGLEGFIFRIQQSRAPFDSTDVYFTWPRIRIPPASTGHIAHLGIGQLSDFHTLPLPLTSTNLPAVVGHVYAVETTNGKYAILRITAFGPNALGGNSESFDYKYQATGATCF